MAVCVSASFSAFSLDEHACLNNVHSDPTFISQRVYYSGMLLLVP